LRPVRKILRERSRNPNREVWESPSVLRRRGCQWLIYAIAEKGKVLHQGLTAIHHRKSGSYY
ncbi:MAG: hypothetical protein RLZZ143_2953, partial [Cyanobacteriota bacterium]